MSTRLETEDRHVTFTVTARITVGYHDCAWCQVELPGPTDDQLLVFARLATSRRDSWQDVEDGFRPGGYFWPGTDRGDQYVPAGCVNTPAGLVCPACATAYQQLITSRRPSAV